MKTVWLINEYASTPETGTSTRHVDLAYELSRRGYDVYVIAARWHHKLFDEAAADAAPFVEERDGYRYVRLTMPRYGSGHDPRRAANWLRFGWKLASLDRRLGVGPDVVLYSSPGLVAYLGAERLARRVGARLVFEVRDIWPMTLVEVGGKSARHPAIRFMQWVED